MRIQNDGVQFNIPSQQNMDDSSGTLKEGQTIRAKISKTMDGLVFLDLGNGEMLEAKLTASLPLQPGQLCDFLVKEVQDHQILLKPILNDAEPLDATEKKIMSLLEKMGLFPDKEKIEIIREMIRFQLPIHENTLKEIASLKTAYEKVSDWAHLLPLEEEQSLSEKPIQAVFKKALSTNPDLERTAKVAVSSPGTDAGANIEKGKINERPLLEVEDRIYNTTTKQPKEVLEKIVAEWGKGETGIRAPIPSTGFNLQNMTYEKIIFLLKNNFQMNIQNASNVNQILFHAAPIGKQIEDLARELQEHKEIEQLVKSFEDISSRMKPSIIQNKESIKDSIRDVYNNIQNIKDLVENGTVKISKSTMQQLDSLKSGIDFINKINHYQGFLQLPIHIKGEQRNLEIILCNKKKKNSLLNPSDLKIFISLDTKSMDTVQAFIEIKEKHVAVNFRLMSEQIKNYVIEHEVRLNTALKAMGFTKIDTSYGIYKDQLDLITVLEQESLLSQKQHNFVDAWV